MEGGENKHHSQTPVKLMKDLLKRQTTLINLITRVGGKQNIQKWMDELLKIDCELETEVEKMFKIKVTELHTDIQLELAQLVNGVLTNGVIKTSVNPETLNWEELEIALYGDIDFDSDRLIECVSWEEAVQVEVKADPLKAAIEDNLASFEDLQKYLVNGADFALFNNQTLLGAIRSYTYGVDPKYCGEGFAPTGKTKQVTEHEQMDGFGFADSVSESTSTKYQYKHRNGVVIWAGEDFKSLPTQEEIMKDLQNLTYTYCKRNKLTWEQLVATVESRKARNDQERLEKLAAEEAKKLQTSEPEWFKDEIWAKSLTNFWVGDECKYSFWWNSEDGTVWQECDDRTKGLAKRTRETKSIGSDRETVVSYISSLYIQREAAQQKAAQQVADYEAYKKAQKAKGGIVKPFERWLATVV